MTQINLDVPKHVGIILDGNRRWAKKQHIPSLEGHRQGAETFREVALAVFDRGVEYLSAFVFSAENWSRTEEETSYLMKLVVKAVEKYLSEFHKKGIKIIVIGNREKLKPEVLKAIKQTEEKTSNNTNGTLILCFNYGGQQEIIDTTKQIISKKTKPEEVTIELFEQNLYSPEIPPIDLLIRTSGEQRISGFMLWRVAYAELLFSDKLWPDYTVKDFDEALIIYKKRQRRFGG